MIRVTSLHVRPHWVGHHLESRHCVNVTAPLKKSKVAVGDQVLPQVIELVHQIPYNLQAHVTRYILGCVENH